MAGAYVTLNGQRVAPGTAMRFLRMAAAIYAALGVIIYVVSGTRLRSEQEAIFRARYVTAPNVRGRKVYDTRWWNGRMWYRISPAGTVAVPGTSLHESDRALDIGGGGVATAGTVAANWIRANARRFGFAPNGYNFREPWHIEDQGDPWDSTVAAVAAMLGEPAPTQTAPEKPEPEPQSEDEGEEDMKGLHYTRAADKVTVFMLFNEMSGFYVEHSGVNADYNNPIAGNWKTGTWVAVTEAHARVIKQALDAVRRTTIAGQIVVDASVA